MTAALDVWAEGVRRVHDQAAGVVRLLVILPADLPALLAGAVVGDPEARKLATCVSHAKRGIERAPRKRPMLCGSCPRPLLGGRYSIVCAIPNRADASEALTLGICFKCGNDEGTIARAAARALTDLWPDARILDQHPSEGRA